MIRYNIAEVELWRRINRLKPTWQANAATATALFRQAGTYGERDDQSWDTQTFGPPPRPFWGQIKAVYMGLQKNKCALCEQKLSVRTRDHDVEHFRPKRGVEAWPPPGGPSYGFPTGQAFSEGYYLLAYHPLNYATSCNHCNQGLKRSYFPIESARIPGKDHPRLLKPELPLLLYPIGQIDTDPEDLLGFQGISVGPKNTDPTTHDYHRARVTIDLFDLQKREELRRERAEVIQQLFIALENENSSRSNLRRMARKAIRQKISGRLQHTNCARCFVGLYRQDPAEAGRLANLATDFLNTL